MIFKSFWRETDRDADVRQLFVRRVGVDFVLMLFTKC